MDKEIKLNEDNLFLLKENSKHKKITSKNYNYMFSLENGNFYRWGSTYEDDPVFSPIGPEILDLEISAGKCLGKCPFCYKCNGEGETNNLSFEDFKNIFHKVNCNHQLTQIAFGICDIGTNPEFFKMMQYAKDNLVIPNYTMHGLDLTDEFAKKTAELCGAVAISLVDKDVTYNAVKKLTDLGMTQVNIHYMLSEETYDNLFTVFQDIKSDARLSKLNAIVLLQFKNKGNGIDKFHSIKNPQAYVNIIKYCKENQIDYGFDSCSAPLFLHSLKEFPELSSLAMMAEPCESSLFSSYINYRGEFFPCSFMENSTEEWKQGINVLELNDFMSELWYNPKITKWRDTLINSSKSCNCKWNSQCRSCPVYSVSSCKSNNI